jgi:chromosome segregation ATPase
MSDLDLHLKNFDFTRDNESTEIPNQNLNLHIRPSQSSQKTSFQALLSQNEDLTARLRVTLQNFAEKDQLNENLQQRNHDLESRFSALNDQILIWKEKEKIWRNKEANWENSSREEKIRLEIETSLLRQKASQAEELELQVARFQKYQDKIKTSVKPYISQLKGYAKSLLEQTKSMNQTLIENEGTIEQLKRQLDNKQAALEAQGAKYENEKNQLILYFEDERTGLKKEIIDLRQMTEVLEEKSRLLNKSLERQDELENLVVALRRSKDEIIHNNVLELEKLRGNHKKVNEEISILRVRNEDMAKEVHRLSDKLNESEKNSEKIKEQLTSLRFQWTSKSQENDKLQLSVRSLEKINQDLSQKLKSLREDTGLS